MYTHVYTFTLSLSLLFHCLYFSLFICSHFSLNDLYTFDVLSSTLLHDMLVQFTQLFRENLKLLGGIIKSFTVSLKIRTFITVKYRQGESSLIGMGLKRLLEMATQFFKREHITGHKCLCKTQSAQNAVLLFNRKQCRILTT